MGKKLMNARLTSDLRDLRMRKLDEVWVVQTRKDGSEGWYYVGAKFEADVRRMLLEKLKDETIATAKRVTNVEGIERGELRAFCLERT